MADWSSATISVATTSKLRFLRISATAGPERSARWPRAEESLTVRTAAVCASEVRTSGVEEDIFLFFPGVPVFIAFGFVQHAQTFHQQALSVQSGGLLAGLAFEVDLEVSAGPAQHLENRGIASERTVDSVRDLAFLEVHLAFVAVER